MIRSSFGNNGKIYGVQLGPRPQPIEMNTITTGDPSDGSQVYSLQNGAYLKIADNINTFLRTAKCACNKHPPTPPPSTAKPPAVCCTDSYPTPSKAHLKPMI
jgi:hypothetical protein